MVKFTWARYSVRETANELLMLAESNPPRSYVDDSFNEYNGDPLIRIYLWDFAASEGIKSDVKMPIRDERLFQRIFEKATSKWLCDQLVPNEDDSDFESWRTFKRRVYSVLMGSCQNIQTAAERLFLPLGSHRYGPAESFKFP